MRMKRSAHPLPSVSRTKAGAFNAEELGSPLEVPTVLRGSVTTSRPRQFLGNAPNRPPHTLAIGSRGLERVAREPAVCDAFSRKGPRYEHRA